MAESSQVAAPGGRVPPLWRWLVLALLAVMAVLAFVARVWRQDSNNDHEGPT